MGIWSEGGSGGGSGPSLADSVASETSFGLSPDAGEATTASRSDHTHGTPANPGGSGSGSTLTTTIETADGTPSSSTWSWKGNAVAPITAFQLSHVGIWANFVSGGTYRAAVITRASGLVDTVTLSSTATAGRSAWGLVWVQLASAVTLSPGTEYGILLGRTDAGDSHALPVNYPNGLSLLPIPAEHVTSWRVAEADLQSGDTVNTFSGTVGTGFGIVAP